MRFAVAISCATLAFEFVGSSHAQQAACAAPLPAIYVGEFQPAEVPNRGVASARCMP
jgi:hypothetical protein